MQKSIFAFFDVHFNEYDVLLSYPTNWTSPNHVRIFKNDGSPSFESQGDEPMLVGNERTSAPKWLAYSENGNVTGELVYAYYGRQEDFDRLKELKIDVKGKIVLVRYGGRFARSKFGVIKRKDRF